MTEASEPQNDIEVTEQLAIPLSEIQFQFSRSGGPGGQNVNRRETRVELLFDVRNSASLSEEQREFLLMRLASRVDRDGILHVVACSERSQLLNRQKALERFLQVLRRALQIRRPRVASKPSRKSRFERLEEKRRRSEIKQHRQPINTDGDR
jgi:ribosome-associated protein